MFIITNAQIVLDNKIIRGELKINDGFIVEIGRKLKRNDKCKIIDAENKYLIPGFVDIHTNGVYGFDLICGSYNHATEKFKAGEKDYYASLEKGLKYYLRSGCTKVVLTSISAPVKKITDAFRKVADYKKNGKPLSPIIHGFFLEGSFIKSFEARGAQNPKYFVDLNRKQFNEFYSASDGLLKIVNIPSEWGKPGFDLTKLIAGKGIIPAVGHSRATGDELFESVKNGAVLAVHFLNGKPSTSYKPFFNGGLTEAQLKADEMILELIPDGYHVDKSYVLDTIKRKGFEKIIAISDNTFLTGIKNLDEFTYLGVKGEAGKDGKYIFIKERYPALYGSILTMEQAFQNLLNWQTTDTQGVWYDIHRALDFDEALIRTAQMCSSNPSKLLKRFDAKVNFGKIEEGKKADLRLSG